MTEDELNQKRFDLSIQIRNLEIDLFWKRSLFFWGFIAAAFVGYAALRQSELRIVVACFGMVCSCAWTLVNRGSKYWQESWETKVGRLEVPAIGTDVLFAQEEDRQSDKGCWLSGRKYSVSKLAIALSDYVFLLWLATVIGEFAHCVTDASGAIVEEDRVPTSADAMQDKFSKLPPTRSVIEATSLRHSAAVEVIEGLRRICCLESAGIIGNKIAEPPAAAER